MKLIFDIQIILVVTAVIILIFLISKRIKDKKNEDFEKRDW